MVSFPPVSPVRPYRPPYPHPYAPYSQPISFFSILSREQYWVRSTNHLAPRYAVSSIPRYLFPPRSTYSPQHHVLKHPQLPFLPQCQRPSFTPIQNKTLYTPLSSPIRATCPAHPVRISTNENLSKVALEPQRLF